jgi:hypothetical protein
MEIGLYTFGERTPHWADGRSISAQQRLQDILAAAKLADQAGFDVFAIDGLALEAFGDLLLADQQSGTCYFGPD